MKETDKLIPTCLIRILGWAVTQRSRVKQNLNPAPLCKSLIGYNRFQKKAPLVKDS